jgi:hypothetical protein
MSSIPPGCVTTGWRNQVRVSRIIEQQLRREPRKLQLLARAFDTHDGKLHRLLGRDRFVHTVAWLDPGARTGCIIASRCSAGLTFSTTVSRGRVVSAR